MLIYLANRIQYPDRDRQDRYNKSTGYPLFSSSTNYALSSTNTKLSVLMPIPKTGNITGITFTLQSVTSSQPILLSIQTPDASTGYPSGSNYGGSSGGAYSTTLTAYTLTDATLGTVAAAIAGDMVCVVFEWNSTQGDIRVAVSSGGNSVARFSAGIWSNSVNCGGIVGFVYDDGSYESVIPLIQTTVAHIYNSASSGANEYGLAVTVPFACSAAGAWIDCGYFGSVENNLAITLYSGSSPLTQWVGLTRTLAVSGGVQYCEFARPVSLLPGIYFLGVSAEASSGNAVSLFCAQVSRNAQFSTWCGGVGVYQCHRLNGVSWSGGVPSYNDVSWSTTETENMPIGLMLDQVDDGKRLRGRRGN